MGDLNKSDTAGSAAAKRGLAALSILLLALAAPVALAQSAAPKPRPRPAPAAQPAPGGADSEDDEASTVSELVVSSTRTPPGAVVGDIKPEITLTPQQVQAYGVSTVSDLLNELAPQTSTGPGSGPPVVLLNGRRISGFNEIRDIPTEAIQRVEILPQEVALKYGYSADQRVVNIVLRRFFRALTGDFSGGGPTEGGQAQGQGQLDLMRIQRDVRTNIALKAQASGAITENERDVTQPISAVPTDPLGNVVSATPGGEIDPALSAIAGRPVLIAGVPPSLAGAPTLQDFATTANAPNASDVGRYRTLTGSSRQASANVVMTRPTVLGAQVTVNATFEATHGESLQGLPGVTLLVPSADPFSPFATPVNVAWDVTKFGPLRQTSDGWTGHLGATVNRDLGKWRFTLNSAYDHAYSATRSDIGVDAVGLQQRLDSLDPSFNPFMPIDSALPGLRPPNRASSNTDTANVSFLASGPFLSLPAGKMNLSLHVGDNQSWYAARSTLLGVDQRTNLSRNDLSGQLNLDAPITRRGGPVLAFLGDLTLNGNAAVDQLSDFGTLTTLGYGANWRPTTTLTLLVSHTRNATAPSFQQFGGPVVVTPGVRVFDFTTGRTVDVDMITGGNPALQASRRDITRIGLMLKPLAKQDLTFTANFSRAVTRNTISTFPAATGQIQAVFPDRFIRDPDGDLAAVDYRPVNFTSETKSELRWGINFTKAFGKPPPPPSREEIAALRQRFAGRIQQFQREFQQRRAAQGQAAQGQAGQQPAAAGQGGQPSGAPGADGQPPNVPFGPPPGGFPGGGPGGPPGGGPPGGPGGGGFGGFGGRGGGGGGFGGGGRGGNQPGRIQFAIYHTIVFQDQILVRPGGPVFDLLNGYPAGSGGGEPQHQIEAQAGVTWKGLGARASGKWQSSTFISGEGSPTGALYFAPLATVDLRLFLDFAQQRSVILKHPLLAGTRVTLAVTNLFDNRQRVRDAAGLTPISYQPAYLDPVGRVVRLSLRKLFF